MLQYMVLSLNTTVPFILLAGLGMFLKWRGMIGEKFITQGNKVIFYFGIPVTIFRHIYSANLSDVMDLPFLGFNALWLIGFFLVTWLLAVKLMRDKSSVSSFVNSAYRSSLSVVAPPLLVLMFEGHANPDILPKGILAVSVLLILSYATASVLFAVQDPGAKKNNVLTVLVSIAKNPIVIGVVVGLLFNLLGISLPRFVGEVAYNSGLLGISLPTFVGETAYRLSGIVMPLAMICVGANLSFKGFDAKFKYVIISVVVKLFLMPVVAVLVALLFGFRGNDLTIIMILNALPMAVGAYVMQAELGGDTYIGSSALMLTMTLSAFTLTLFIFLFRVIGFLV